MFTLFGTVALALRISAVLSVIGAGIAWATVGGQPCAEAVLPVDLLLPCHDPGELERSA